MCLPLLAIPIAAGISAALSAIGTAGGAIAGGAIGAVTGGIAGASAGTGIAAGAVSGATIMGGMGAAAGGSAGAGALAATAGALGMTTGQLLLTGGTLISTGVSTATSIKQANQQAAAAEEQGMREFGVAMEERDQRRQAAQTDIETSRIQSMKAVGAVQNSGLSSSSISRLAREARAVSLRDVGDIQKNFEFARIATRQTTQAINASVTNARRSGLSPVGVGLGIGNSLLSSGLQIGRMQLENQETPTP